MAEVARTGALSLTTNRRALAIGQLSIVQWRQSQAQRAASVQPRKQTERQQGVARARVKDSVKESFVYGAGQEP